ncbi:DUF6950 family protein [Alteromonas sp. RKMC-009]|uniref:DUF6950 family protein n=1 Tax=Alteromonas sp. RKMC-009 TaxID=2267264 RepID=UPI000E69C564|nr:hypothetical protein [Alteromonas sp. RKMC-009]AYA63832.1 hypothetical protein DS731_07360 [Alteromonas sp. RKMC-009]
MKRLTTWTQQLTQFITGKKHQPFEWGVNDCCLFAADAVLAITGEDPAIQFRNRYSTRLGAARVLKNEGHDNIESAITAMLGEPVPRLSVRRGDVVLVDLNGDMTAGIMFGQVLAPGEQGIATVSPLDITTVWRVG